MYAVRVPPKGTTFPITMSHRLGAIALATTATLFAQSGPTIMLRALYLADSLLAVNRLSETDNQRCGLARRYGPGEVIASVRAL